VRLLPDMAYNPFTIDEYEVLACWMNTLAAEYHRTHDEKIKAEIFAIASQLVELRKYRLPQVGAEVRLDRFLKDFTFREN
jgi:hypothetical protein